MKEILLTQGKVALVDDDLFEFLNQFKWYAAKMGNDKTFYARRKYNKKIVSLHHYVAGYPLNSFEIDHYDGNSLNNQRSNLRIVTHKINMQNMVNIKKSSTYLGVSWNKLIKKWTAQTKINGRKKHLGCFKNELEAFQAYTEACREIGEPCLWTSTEKQKETRFNLS